MLRRTEPTEEGHAGSGHCQWQKEKKGEESGPGQAGQVAEGEKRGGCQSALKIDPPQAVVVECQDIDNGFLCHDIADTL